ncbi:MAG: phosphoglucomutase/phosphomannomutase family protein [Desulfuromonadales bacterium]|nr:phosphoglucomutase/phosphomannomutase family protein [Desulfuromonadales bacterium]
MSEIRFGTSGWRGILAEDFTLANVRVVTQAIADYLRAIGEADKGVVIGHDSRFFGERFARETARVLAGAGVPSFLCNRDTPTPVIAFEILRRQAGGAINFTASHNPYEYNGIKFSTSWGGPALPEVTIDIEKRANAMLGEICYRNLPLDQAVRNGLVQEIDPMPAYLDALRRKVDLAAIGRSRLTLVVDPMYGAGRGYLDTLLVEAGLMVQTINAQRDPYFGGLPPDPTKTHLNDLIIRVKSDPAIALGLATDGDADRYGIIDADGSFIEPNYILALLYDYLLRRKGEKGDAARSVATSHFIDAVAAHHGFKVRETPVGFKYIGEFIRDDQIVIGGEESAGLTVRGHVPDKDGILACLLVAEMVAAEGKSLKQLLADLYHRVGEFHTGRQNLHLSAELEAGYADKVKNLPTALAGRKVLEVITVDGVKLLLEGGGWVLFRKSGTEPVVRVYAEAHSAMALNELTEAAVAFVKQ